MFAEGSENEEQETESDQGGAPEASAHDVVDIDKLPPLALAEALERYRFDGPVDEAKRREEWQDEAPKDAMGR